MCLARALGAEQQGLERKIVLAVILNNYDTVPNVQIKLQECML